MTSIWELPNVYFQNLLLNNNTPDNNLQPQMHICPLPCTPWEHKLAESAYFWKTDSKLTQITSICELPNVYFQNLLPINNTPDNNLQPQMHICPLPCTPCDQKLAESVYFKKTDSKLTQMTTIWELPNVQFQNLLLINNTPDNNLQPQMHICPLPCTPCEQKLAESVYFKKTDSKLAQITSIWELTNVYFQNLLLINNTPDNNLQTQMHICPLPRTPFKQ